MLDICILKLHAGVRGGILQSWSFLFLNFCILLYSLWIWFVYLFLLLLHHLDPGNLWPSFLLSFFFPGLKNPIPFSSLRPLIQLLPSDSQLQHSCCLFLSLTWNFWSPPFCLHHIALAHLLCCQRGLPRIFWSVLVTLFWWKNKLLMGHGECSK